VVKAIIYKYGNMTSAWCQR